MHDYGTAAGLIILLSSDYVSTFPLLSSASSRLHVDAVSNADSTLFDLVCFQFFKGLLKMAFGFTLFPMLLQTPIIPCFCTSGRSDLFIYLNWWVHFTGWFSAQKMAEGYATGYQSSPESCPVQPNHSLRSFLPPWTDKMLQKYRWMLLVPGTAEIPKFRPSETVGH